MKAGEFPRSVVVYGTGLMGSSFALALRKYLPGVVVFGMDEPGILDRARRLGIAESGPPPDPETVDLAILSAPVGAILHLLDEISPKHSLILDVGSTKVEICRKAEALGLAFAGGHPMTGSERSGPEAASAELFRDAAFFLCPVSTTPEGGIERLQRIVKAIGATPHVMAPEEHDRVVARLSHLPQILSTLLADQTSEHRDLAGPGWKSVTRLAASPFHVWRDILQTSGSLPAELRSFAARLHSILDALDAENMDEIQAAFERANRAISGRKP